MTQQLTTAEKPEQQKVIPTDVLELLSQLEYHWQKARELIPRIYEVGIGRGMKPEQIRRLINQRVDLSSRQIRNLTPEQYKDIKKRNRRQAQPNPEVDYSEVMSTIQAVVNSKQSNVKKVREIIKVLKGNRLV